MFKVFGALLSTVLIVLAPFSSANSQTTVSDTERKKIETVVEDYLAENPLVVIRAIQEFQRRQQIASMLPQVQLYRGFLENDPDSTVIGNPDGDVTIVEFFDYRCGFCRRHFASAILPLLEEDKNIRFIPQQYPVLDRPNTPPVSRMAARASLAAHKQGKFAEFHTALMTTNSSPTETMIFQVAESVGLDMTQLKSDMQSKLIDKKIENLLAIGQEIGFTGTPGYIIGDDVILGAEGIDRIKSAIARARENNKASGR